MQDNGEDPPRLLNQTNEILDAHCVFLVLIHVHIIMCLLGIGGEGQGGASHVTGLALIFRDANIAFVSRVAI